MASTNSATESLLVSATAVARFTVLSAGFIFVEFSGDTGAVGRIAVESKKKGRGLTFDLKGKVHARSVERKAIWTQNLCPTDRFNL